MGILLFAWSAKISRSNFRCVDRKLLKGVDRNENVADISLWVRSFMKSRTYIQFCWYRARNDVLSTSSVSPEICARSCVSSRVAITMCVRTSCAFDFFGVRGGNNYHIVIIMKMTMLPKQKSLEFSISLACWSRLALYKCLSSCLFSLVSWLFVFLVRQIRFKERKEKEV